MCDNKDNVVFLEDFKKERDMNILSFSELIRESSNIVNELEKKPLSEELGTRSKQVLTEMDKRMDQDGFSLSQGLKQIRLDLEKRLKDILGTT